MKKNYKNKRNFFRVDAYIPMASRRTPRELRGRIKSALLAWGEIPFRRDMPLKKVDISGGGMSFESQEHYLEGEIIEISMLLKTWDGELVVYGEVVRVDQGSRYYRVAVKFVAIDERVRAVITKFVFLRERELLQEKKAGWL
jgi:hypothetical protein